MNLVFNYENPIHHFKVIGEITQHDIKVIRVALYRLFESKPEYVILNFSQVTNQDQVPKIFFTQVLTELTSLALSKKIFFYVAKNTEEADLSIHTILDQALEQKQSLLNSKNKVKEEIKDTVKKLFEENDQLKRQLDLLKSPEPKSNDSMTSLLDKFWNPE